MLLYFWLCYTKHGIRGNDKIKHYKGCEPSQSLLLVTSWRSKRTSDFRAFRISEFRVRDTKLYY
jgi:hypothetical protein